MRTGEVQKIFLEAMAVAIVGAGLAFAANELSPRGLTLRRNYFPTGVATATNLAPTRLPSRQDASDDDAVAARLKSKGLVCIGRNEVERLLVDSQIIFVDARDEDKFEEGHIPGAYELDPYHPERAMGTVLPLCQAAPKVVVYCAGGECEDADSVAILLRDAGVSADRLVVYGGGMNDWLAQHKPVEKGAHT
jgi:rhodanese-related sulfurtransferase